MKKYIIYIGILALGLLLGWFIFGDSPNKDTEHNHNESEETNQKWTCSMHPQIMQTEPGECPICGMDLIPAEVGVKGLAPDQFKLTKNAIALANIQTTIVGNVNAVDDSIKLTGKISANEEENAVQVSYFSGRIEHLKINYTGEEVRKGQLLATIYSPELYAAQQELITASGLKESQPALYKAVRNKLKLWKLSESQIGQIESSGKVKKNFPVFATVSGTVSEKLVNQGEAIKQGQPLFKIVNLNTVWANFDVYENQIVSFKKDQNISISTNAYPNKIFNAKVDFIDPILNTRTRTVTLRAVLNNINNEFKPGMFVEGKIDGVLNSTEVLTIPTSAVLWTGQRSVVYLKTNPNEPIFVMKEVILGKQIGKSYQIVKGLNNGDAVVTNGTFTIDAAAQLQGKKSMMNHKKMISENFEVSSKFKLQLQNTYDKYIDLKDALIKTDAILAQKHAQQILETFKKIDMNLLADNDAHKQWLKLATILNSSSKKIATSTDIVAQRKQFKIVSEHLILAIQSFGINETTYKQYCPMADSDKGAYWLSKEKQVLNPYFGNMMLKCGEVKEIINNN